MGLHSRLDSGRATEAITSPLTFVATPNSVLYQGRTPIFADVCADTLNVDPDRVSERNHPEDAGYSAGCIPGN